MPVKSQPRKSWVKSRRDWYWHIRHRAHDMVEEAVRNHTLSNLKKRRIQCSDCPARAIYYDHRDYAKPLKVDPVCGSCNWYRGSGIVSTRVPRGWMKYQRR
jgi:hypothetical protein